MVNIIEKVFVHSNFDEVRKAYVSAAQRHAGRIADDEEWLRGRGYEQVDAVQGSLLLDDGREVLRLHGKAWALRPEAHAQRVAAAFDSARKRDEILAQASRPTATCLALIDGQLCGRNLVLAAVCPRCALGKSGVAATLTCDDCLS